MGACSAGRSANQWDTENSIKTLSCAVGWSRAPSGWVARAREHLSRLLLLQNGGGDRVPAPPDYAASSADLNDVAETPDPLDLHRDLIPLA